MCFHSRVIHKTTRPLTYETPCTSFDILFISPYLEFARIVSSVMTDAYWVSKSTARLIALTPKTLLLDLINKAMQITVALTLKSSVVDAQKYKLKISECLIRCFQKCDYK